MSDERQTRRDERLRAREELRVAGDLKGQRARHQIEKLLTRTTSGAIYAISILVCLYLGPIATALLVAAMSWLACSELYRMMRMGGRMPNEVLGLAATVAYPIVLLLHPTGQPLVTFLLLLSVCLWYVITPQAGIGDVAVTVFGSFYTGLMLSAIVAIRMSDPGQDGALLTFLLMGSVWINDAFAYFVGSRFGHTKLAPKISPHKTWEGLFGGLVGSVIVWLIIARLGVLGVGVPIAILEGVVMGVAGVIGDLTESRIKRGIGVKDSGNIMPGHGGLLDRSDSLIFACMCGYIILRVGGIL